MVRQLTYRPRHIINYYAAMIRWLSSKRKDCAIVKGIADVIMAIDIFTLNSQEDGPCNAICGDEESWCCYKNIIAMEYPSSYIGNIASLH